MGTGAPHRDRGTTWGQGHHAGTGAPHGDRGTTPRGDGHHMGTGAPHGDRGIMPRGDGHHVGTGATPRRDRGTTWGQGCHARWDRGATPRGDRAARAPTGRQSVQDTLHHKAAARCSLMNKLTSPLQAQHPLIYSPFLYFCHFKNVIYLESCSLRKIIINKQMR